MRCRLVFTVIMNSRWKRKETNIMKKLWNRLCGSTDYYMLEKVKSMEPSLLIFMFIKTAVGISMPLLSVLLLQKMVDGLLEGSALDLLLFYVATLFLMGAITALLNRCVGEKVDQHTLSFVDKMEAYLSSLSMDIDYELLDKPEYLKSSDKAYRPIRNQGVLSGYTESMAGCLQTFILTLSVGGVIASCNIWVLLFIICCAWGIRTLQKNKLKIDSKYEDRMAVIDRRYEYYDKIVCDMSFGKEVRLYGMYDYLMGKIRADNKHTLGGTFAQLYRAYGRVDGLCGMIKHLERVAICGLLVWSVLSGHISIGGYTAAMTASVSLSRGLNSLIESYFSYKKSIGYLKGLKDYCTMCEAHYSVEKQSTEESGSKNLLPIVLNDVSFQYEGASQNALTGLNLTFEEGKRYAIVGENGAGKTTLVKLLLGYYLPCAGDITLGGAVDCKRLRQVCVPLFQQVNMYPDSIQRNITLSGDPDMSELNEAVKFARLRTMVSHHGLQTLLCRDYSADAIDLSGGEQQRVALARTIYHTRNITIMDEPTSAMDAAMEMHVYADLNQTSPHSCTVFVSHRMACCRFVDQVIVMKEGRVCAVGSHTELLHSSEEYVALWNAQAERYG